MKYRNILKKRILAGLLAGVAACAAAPALAASGVVPNTQLPQGGNFVAGDGTIGDPFNGQMNITQNTQNGVIKWDGGFNIGANATVNFEGPQNGYNTLNYDASGNMSQIYGAINANNNGNIYIVNPAGVEISNSAQINVGSLYVSNKKMTDENLSDFQNKAGLDAIYNIQGETQDAVLMSLGNINATNVTFDGGRIVIDTERLKDVNGDAKLTKDKITVHTNNAANVVIGYDAYNEGDNKGTYKGKNKDATAFAQIWANGNKVEEGSLNAYMWVEDVEQLQAIDTNLGGNYALRNSIDATATQEWNNGAGFKPIGIDSTGKVIVENSKYGFHGNFDGLSYNIFNLNINRADAVNVGLFGVLHEAEINNVTFVGGAITGGNVVGSLAGAVLGNTHVNNVMNSASVTGGADVGGIVGYSGDNVDGSSAEQTGTSGSTFTGLINTGTVTGKKQEHIGEGNNVGGLIGYLYNGTLGGTSYNLGSVTGSGSNVGGLVGHAVNSVIGNEDMIDEGGNVIAEGTTVYNRLNVTGAYNVGGIVGNMVGTTVQNAENSGTIAATGYTDGKYYYHSRNNGTVHVEAVDVRFANAGGIAGNAANVEGRESKIENVLNTGDVSSIEWNIGGKTTLYRYTGGNVGGIVGSAVDTNITNATNRENNIRGAINVGGVAGYFANSDDTNATKYTVTNGINDGGDILGSGLTSDNGIFATEIVRPTGGSNEKFTIGNIGGVVGYMDGDNVYITASANRGTVHTKEPSDPAKVQQYEKAANVGGIVGKIDRSHTKELADQSKDDYSWAAVSNSYNTGDVMGYTGVGGIAGMMYNGEIAGSYNLGYLRTTRQSALNDSIDALNMGGIVGDTTENSGAKVVLYDVYNKGQIGDEDFTYFGRHVGGIVGRLSGTVEKAYNTGAIYNGYNVVGGIAGWIYEGSIKNAFNTGNITVVNQNNATSQVGGIAGAASTNVGVTLENVYNLGTIRSFRNTGAGNNTVGGILGIANGTGKGKVSITNAYTTGNIWAGNQNEDNSYSEDTSNFVRSIWGRKEGSAGDVQIENTYYIRPDKENNLPFTDLSEEGRNNSNKAIDFADKNKADSYKYTDDSGTHSLGFSSQTGGDVTVEKGQDWRIYEGSTPILNAFLPNAEDYFDQYTDDTSLNGAGIGSIQYGTAYDPLLTIIKANEKGKEEGLSFNWQDLKINNDAGLAVYGAGLTLKDFMSTGGSGYFGGLIYSDGALTIKADTAGGNPHSITGDVALGSASQLYGSSVAIDADGQVTIYGSVTATGNGTMEQNDPEKDNSGSISITGGNVDIYGQLTSAKKDGDVFVPGINGIAADWKPGDVNNPKVAMSDIGDRFGYTTSKSKVTGNISITANDAEDGHVNIYYGNKGEGIVTTGGDLTVTASGDIYMDSDLSIGGNLTLNAGYKEGEDKPAADSEAVLDISNIGKVQAAEDGGKTSVEYLHEEFLHHFSDGTHGITMEAGSAKIAVDMWDETENNGNGGFDLTKYDSDKTLAEELNGLTINGEIEKGKDYTYIWVSTGEQLKGIQEAAKTNSDFLGYNFALKNDIDASGVTDYEAIGTGSADGYTGTFDGRDNRIIGLDTTKKADGTTQTLTNAGIFDTIGAGGKVEDLRVYSGRFTGRDNAGAVAGVNKGNISNVTTFGNVVQSAGNAGGIVGTNITENPENIAEITNVSAIGIATAGDQDAITGGIAGTNAGKISNSSTNSAVDSSSGGAAALGGVAGVNKGTLDNVDSLGVTTGIYKGENTKYSDNVGGIAGKNSGTVTNAYNESIVSGRENVGGVLGTNLAQTGSDKKSPVSNVANAADVTGESAGNDSKHVGGLVGDNEGSITNGRNNGKITGNNYVGGLVGANGAGSTLTNLVNDSAAAITGDKWVGGIAGSNAGKITASSVDEDGQVIEGNNNLINRGTIKGQQYVGGVAGVNTGTIANTNNDVKLYVKDPNATGDEAPRYFGGVAGMNGYVDKTDETKNKTGIIENAKNEATIIAEKADFVGGIVGWNTEAGVLQGMGNSNEGLVEGNSHVGGVAGLNDAAITGKVNSMVGIENSGVVIAHNGGAGGIFGENNGNIEYVEMTNKGIVSGSDSKDKNGTDGTGGIFGVNKGNVIHSSLKNEIGGQVMGTQNVGGLIGQNSGDITGGRDENDGSYKYQIYNNGTIQTGTWNDDDKDGIVDKGELTAAAGDSENIAGLFGTNSGKVTAGYNTGAVIAENSTHVGGIAGTNEGTLNQVFNTVITGVNEDGANVYGSITGHTNVGGIAGTNTKNGTISNAYNTTATAGTVSGAIAGANSGAIFNVYGSEKGTLVDSGKLVGSGSDTVSNVYDSEKDTFGDGGSAIDKKGGASASTTPWRQYGDNNPILKVFLTTVTYDEMKNNQSFTYNGKDQKLDIGGLITSGAFDAADKFDAHKNVEGGLIFHDNASSINAGDYTDDFWSVQIGAGKDGNPNNLGYDVQSVKYKIGKATIDVSLDDIFRLYGDSNMYKDANRTQGSNNYEDYWHISVKNADDFDQNVLNDALESIRDKAMIVDKGKGTNGRTTADAGDYDWQVQVNISDIASNFQLKDQEGATTHSYEYANGSHVAKAELTVTVGNVETTYGTAFDPTKYGYTLDGVTNGDTSDAVKELIGQVDYTNDAAKDGTGGVWTADAGTYTDAVGVTQNGTALDSVEDLLKNYTVKVDKGNAQVNKAEMEIIADDKEMYAGDTIPSFTGTDISSQFVNGDTLSGWYYGPEGTVDSSVGGSHIIGVYFGNGQYAGSNSFDWTTAWDGFKNYNVTFTPGTLTVRDFPEGMPDISDIPSIERHWNFLFDDNPWDRNRDFRERKAEVHFVAGGMTL